MNFSSSFKICADFFFQLYCLMDIIDSGRFLFSKNDDLPQPGLFLFCI